MDDFLHNLRSGKLKQSDRSNRPYGDQQYKGGSRRNVMDRRKGHFDNKESFERIHAIKDALELLADTQKRMAEAYVERTRAEERKARAMEVMAKSLYRIANPTADDAEELFATTAPPVQVKEAEARPAPEASYDMIEEETVVDFEDIDEADLQAETAEDAAVDADPGSAEESQNKLSDDDRQAVSDIVNQMRTEGNSWENIARHISSMGYPTLSGKGHWRGAMVKSLHEKMVS